MAILPRCSISGTAVTTISPALTGWVNSGAGVSGTAPQPGDYVLIVMMDNTSNAGGPTQTAGTTWGVLAGPTIQITSGSFVLQAAGRTWAGTETAPTWVYPSPASRVTFVAVAFAPDAGQVVSVDAMATEKVDSATASLHTPNPATATATDCSVIMIAASSGAQGTTALAWTAPAGWTNTATQPNTSPGTYVNGCAVMHRASQTGTVTPGAATIQGGASSGGTTLAVLEHVLLRESPVTPLAERAAATETMLSGQPTSLPEAAAGVDMFTGASSPPYADFGAVGDETLAVAVAETLPLAEPGGGADQLIVAKLPVPTPVPGLAARIASPAFIISAMPRMHLQNLVTGQWLHRDVQGVSSPSVTWSLNTPDSFTCTLGPPRPDLLTPAGEPIAQEWRDACYLEENGEIKFGGILTGSSFSGPQWQLTFSGFMGFPTGIPYEGPDYVKTRIDALDVVRDLWIWLQSQPNSNLGVVPDATKSGTLVGANVPAGATTTLLGNFRAGSTVIKVHNASGFTAKQQIAIDHGSPHVIKSISGNTITLVTPTGNYHADGQLVAQVVAPTPIAIYWYNSTDIGQEIGNIQTDAVFDMWETHEWTDATRSGVKHRLHFGVPRVGRRQSSLRFAEGENIVSPVQGSRDGSAFANEVVGLGSGQGKAQIRAQVAQVDGHLRRVLVYTDQTITTTARMQSKAQKILTSRLAIDTPVTVTVINHPNAPFGSFVPGDDIYVQWVTGWRNTGIWGRITSMTQDPTTNLMTLTLARSDSFTYMAQSGQAGSL